MAEVLEKKILVKTPVTTNGTNVLIQDGRMVFRETILSRGAKPHLERLNKTLPENLKHVIEDYPPASDKK